MSKIIAAVGAGLSAVAVMTLFTGCTQGAPANTQDVSADAQEAIGIIGAMEEEITPLLDVTEDKKTTTIAAMDFCEGTLNGKKVVIVQCGMGNVNAGICANTLINDFG